MDAMTRLARQLAGAPAAPRPYVAPLNPNFSRGVVLGYNADGSLSCTVNGSPSAVDCDALNGIAPPIGAVVELHSFGTRLVVDGVLNGAAMLSLKVYRAAAFTTGSGWWVMPFDTVIQDDSNGWDATNHRFNVQSPGRYEFYGRTSANGQTRTIASLYKNGVEVLRGGDVTIPSGLNGQLVAGFTDCSAGDYLQMGVYTFTSGAGEPGSVTTYLRIRKTY